MSEMCRCARRWRAQTARRRQQAQHAASQEASVARADADPTGGLTDLLPVLLLNASSEVCCLLVVHRLREKGQHIIGWSDGLPAAQHIACTLLPGP